MRSFILLIIIFVSCGNLYAVNIEQNNLPNSPDLSIFAERHTNIDFLRGRTTRVFTSPEETGFLGLSIMASVITGLATLVPVGGFLVCGLVYIIGFGWFWGGESILFGWLQSWILWTVIGSIVLLIGAPLMIIGFVLYSHYKKLRINTTVMETDPTYCVYYGLKI